MHRLIKQLGRPPRIMWANASCLLDTSSGAAISARQMLRALKSHGADVWILGATIFDKPTGVSRLGEAWETIRLQTGKTVTIEDGDLFHLNLVTRSTSRLELVAAEDNVLYGLFCSSLEEFNPDLVMSFGGLTLDLLMHDTARERGVKTASYLVNPNYSGNRWCRDIDLILTDSRATADKYHLENGYDVKPVGTFIEKSSFLAQTRQPSNILFINPSLEKGAAIVVQIALLLEAMRPELRIEVVESRGDWSRIVRDVTSTLGTPRNELPNVIVTKNTSDMRPVYGRASVLLVPSLWWDSGPRVIAEAMINGVPVITTDHGGCPEMMGVGGALIKLPPECHEPPYSNLPTNDLLLPVCEFLISLYDDRSKYDEFSRLALKAADELHNIDRSTDRLIDALSTLFEKGSEQSAQKSLNTSPPRTVTDSQVLKSLLPFRPNSAGWTGGIQEFLEITLEGASGVISPLRDIFSEHLNRPDVHVQEIGKLELADSNESLCKRLASLLDSNGSDKNAVHNYTPLYAHIISKGLKKSPFGVMEIGLGTNNVDVPSNMGKNGRPGASLRAFRDLDERINVVGADFDKRILFEEERIKTYYINQRDPASFEEFTNTIGLQFDLIIDDGLHAVHANLNSVQHLLPLVKLNGSMVVEDIMESMLPVWQLALKAFDPKNFACTIWKGKAAFAVQIQKLQP